MSGFDLQSLVRPHILSLKPYTSARDEYTGTEGIFLDANENPYQSANGSAYNRYPDPYQWAIKERLAPIKGVRPGQIFLGNGSDEPIDLLYRLFCEPGEHQAVFLPPTYGMYQVSADINRVQAVHVPLSPDFQIRLEETLAVFGPTTRLLFICSPNNPSGNLLRRADVETLVERFPGIVVIDEAYIDFADQPSFCLQLDRYPNLVVLQTFSKAWGMAGLRLGMAFASEPIIQLLNKIKPPYNINLLTQQVALECLGHVVAKDDMVKHILENREQLIGQLLGLPIVKKIFPSDANFFLAQFDNARQVYQYLTEQQVIVRDRSNVKLCEGCLRISVGTESENRALVEALAKLNTHYHLHHER